MTTRHHWERQHANHVLSTVFPSRYKPGKYIVRATARRIVFGNDEIRGLGKAQRWADDLSGCPQPCHCPPWRELH
jgi:hypothetical protein